MAVVKFRGKWRICIYKNKKHHWYKGFYKDEFDARQAELEIRRALKQKLEKDNLIEFIEKLTENKVERNGVLLKAAWDAYLRQPGQDTRSARTIHSKKCIWNVFLLWLSSEYAEIEYLNEITREIAIRYARHLQDKGMLEHTFNNNRNSLHSVFKVLAYSGMMKENPFAVVTTLSAIHEKHRPFTPDEISAIINAAEPEWKTAVWIGLYTGLRFSDVTFLKWSEIKFDTNLIEIMPHKTARLKKEIKVPIYKDLAEKLLTLERTSEYVMPFLAANYNKKVVTKYFGNLLSNLEIIDTKEGTVGFHSLRHTFVTMLQETGASREIARDLAGHGSPEITKIYTHAITPHRKAISKLPKIQPQKEKENIQD